MAKRARIGDVYEIATPSGFAYIQYTHDEESMGELVRVLPGLYQARPDVSNLTRQKELYFAFYTLKPAVRQGLVQFVSHEPVPDWARPFPIMRHWRIWDNGWEIGIGNKPKTLRVKELTPEQRKLSISNHLLPHPAMVKELARGWTPERHEEFRRLDELERRKREEASENAGTQSDQRSVDHYLYFPKKVKAEKAAERLRAKGWMVEVKKGAYGENWLTLAKQPAPVEEIEDIRDELEHLAEDLGGEYDGWGASVKDQPNTQ